MKNLKIINQKEMMSEEDELMIDSRATISVANHKIAIQRQENSFNAYATSKSFSQEFLNTANIQYQIGLMIALFSVRDNTQMLSGFEITLITLITISLIIQFLMVIMLALLAKSTTDKCTKNCTTQSINSIVTILSGLALILNITITVVSVETTKSNVQKLIKSK